MASQLDEEKLNLIKRQIEEAERSLQSAKEILLEKVTAAQVLRKPSKETTLDVSGVPERIVKGTFDGQNMHGEDGNQYPVPANYASKSKLVEGDILKLTIDKDGSFIYKQIGPVERRRVVGTLVQDQQGNYKVKTADKEYKVLLASVTYFKAEPGDEITLLIPKDRESAWGAIENVIKKIGPPPSFETLP